MTGHGNAKESTIVNQVEQSQQIDSATIGEWLVRDLVDRYPSTMPVLSPWGIDLCCGGGRKVGEALELHGAPVDEVLESVVNLIATDSVPASS